MKRLNLYIGRTLVQTTLLAIAILTFVMVCGSFLEMFELLALGVPFWGLLKFIVFSLPFALGFALPLAVLCGAVVVFSRMSADQEITAMRASGISLWQIISPGLILATVASGLCFYFQAFLIPESRLRAEMLQHGVTVANPVAFLEPGRPVLMPGCVVYVGDRDGSRVEDVQLYILDDEGRIAQDIHAAAGTAEYDRTSRTLLLVLEQALFGFVDRGDEQRGSGEVQRTTAERVEVPIQLSENFKEELLTRKLKHLSITGLMGLATLYEKNGFSAHPIYMESHKRLAMAFSPIGFMLMGIPFGIRTRRSETLAGVVVSLVLALVFYIFIALAESLDRQTFLHPELMVWIPIVLYQAGGLIALRRTASR